VWLRSYLEETREGIESFARSTRMCSIRFRRLYRSVVEWGFTFSLGAR
jgi:hypothetical protein